MPEFDNDDLPFQVIFDELEEPIVYSPHILDLLFNSEFRSDEIVPCYTTCRYLKKYNKGPLTIQKIANLIKWDEQKTIKVLNELQKLKVVMITGQKEIKINIW